MLINIVLIDVVVTDHYDFKRQVTTDIGSRAQHDPRFVIDRASWLASGSRCSGLVRVPLSEKEKKQQNYSVEVQKNGRWYILLCSPSPISI
jgi:hypothetical protein